MLGLLTMPVAHKRYPANTAFLAPFETALRHEYPNTGDQIKALLGWYGSGAGPWSGYPFYEDTAAQLLSDYPAREIITIVATGGLTPAQLEGAARYLANDVELWNPADAALLTAPVKQVLLARALQTTDTDKIQRAENAFSG